MSERKKSSRRTRSNKQKLTMYSGVTPVATRLRTKLNYAQSVTPATISVYEYLFNLNSLFDPDRTGAGHQPMGYDQLTPLYNKYRVYSVDYDIEWIPNDSATCMIVAAPTNEAGGLGSLSTALETFGARHSRVGSLYQAMRVTGSVDLAVLNGKTPQQYADDDVTASLNNASPSELLILHACFVAVSGNASSGYGVVKLTFDCEFFDPIQLSAS